MSDIDGAERSSGNGSYIDWLEENWETFGTSEAPEEEPVFFVTHPFMGHPVWPMQTTAEFMKGWMRGLKLGLMTTAGIIALSGAWNGLCWFVNNAQTGFGR